MLHAIQVRAYGLLLQDLLGRMCSPPGHFGPGLQVSITKDASVSQTVVFETVCDEPQLSTNGQRSFHSSLSRAQNLMIKVQTIAAVRSFGILWPRSRVHNSNHRLVHVFLFKCCCCRDSRHSCRLVWRRRPAFGCNSRP